MSQRRKVVLVSKQEVARRLECSQSLLAMSRKRREFPAPKLRLNRTQYWDLDEVAAFVANARHKAGVKRHRGAPNPEIIELEI